MLHNPCRLFGGNKWLMSQIGILGQIGPVCFGLGNHSVHERSARARLGAPGPACSPIFAQNATQQQHQRKNDPLNGYWRRRYCLRMPVAPQHVG